MSAVDVLAVMDKAAAAVNQARCDVGAYQAACADAGKAPHIRFGKSEVYCDLLNEQTKALREARAAVADLIEGRARDLEVLTLAHQRLKEAAARESAKWPRLHANSAADACADRIESLTAALAAVGAK